MEWIYSFFYNTPVTVSVPIPEHVTEETPTALVGESAPPLIRVDPPLIAIKIEDDVEVVVPDPEEFSAEPDSKFQSKARAEQEYHKRCSKRARNKLKRQAKGHDD